MIKKNIDNVEYAIVEDIKEYAIRTDIL